MWAQCMTIYICICFTTARNEKEREGGGPGEGKQGTGNQVFWFIKTLNTPVKNNLTVVN